MRASGAALCLRKAPSACVKAIESLHCSSLVFCGYAAEPGQLLGHSQPRRLGLTAQEGRAKAGDHQQGQTGKPPDIGQRTKNTQSQ